MLYITRNVIYRNKINATETKITVYKANQTKFVLWEKQKIDKLSKEKKRENLGLIKCEI